MKLTVPKVASSLVDNFVKYFLKTETKNKCFKVYPKTRRTKLFTLV